MCESERGEERDEGGGGGEKWERADFQQTRDDARTHKLLHQAQDFVPVQVAVAVLVELCGGRVGRVGGA
jgi:hypothetical protein